jgi:hypothetical protein
MYQIVPLSQRQVVTENGEQTAVLELRDGVRHGYVVVERADDNRTWGYALYELDPDGSYALTTVWPPGVAHMISLALPVEPEAALRLQHERHEQVARVELRAAVELVSEGGDDARRALEQLRRLLVVMPEQFPGVTVDCSQLGGRQFQVGYTIEPEALGRALSNYYGVVVTRQGEPLVISSWR